MNQRDDDVVIVEAVRTPIGKRHGALSTMHSADLLAVVQTAVIERSGIDPTLVGQVVGGCIGQVGQQAFNVTRTAWLTGGLPVSVPSTTVDSQCGSSQQALTLAFGLLKAGVIDVAVACGVEVMSRVPLGAALAGGSFGKGIPRSYFARHKYTTQFEAAELIAKEWGITRRDADEFGVKSQGRAADAWEDSRFNTQLTHVDVPVLDDDGRPTGASQRFEKDECLRPTTLDGLAGLKPVVGDDGVHTAGSSSQIADAASAVLLTTARRAAELDLTPLARVRDVCLVGSDPTLMLTGPIPATELLLKRNSLSISDIDVIEINEAFASVVIAWEREIKPDDSRVNPNGGAIAHGHALGSTGCVLVTKAISELIRADKETALVTMCCGGGEATGTLLERAS
ncbi:acetyl-CoA C-acyltransferase [Mycolicibacterium sp. XJ879]